MKTKYNGWSTVSTCRKTETLLLFPRAKKMVLNKENLLRSGQICQKSLKKKTTRKCTNNYNE